MQILHPESETAWLGLRTFDITSTESAALFGLSPYHTEFELWHRKQSGDVPAFDSSNERMKWGTRLQDAIARGVAEDQGWTVRRLSAYIRHDEVRMGSSFDFEVVNHPDGPGILEVKNVDGLVFRDQWLIDDDGNIEAPEHIEVQLQHQLHVIDREWGVIAALVGGNAPKLLLRRRDRQVGNAIEAKVRAFWASIAAGTPPTPNWQEDAEFISKLYGYAEPGKVVSSTDEQLHALLLQYEEARKAEANAKDLKQACKAQILTIIQDAEKVMTPVGTISAGVVGPCFKSYEQPAYRNFRFYPKKEKAA